MPKSAKNPIKSATESEYYSTTSTSSEELLVSPSKQEITHKNYFNDNKREIDFILVAHDQTTYHFYIYRYIRNLEQTGLEVEIETGTVSSDLIYIKIHAPKDVLLRYADAFKIRLEFRTYERQMAPKKLFFECMVTDLTRPNPDGPIFHRARETVSGEKPTQIITIERIMVVQALLSQAAFGNRDLQYGLGKLLERGAFIAAYPLHDGKWNWTKKGPLNDRQLLANYWANISVWYKEQPLNVVERYYGPEVAFYFAFCGFYNTMLIPASIIGVICFIVGIINVFVMDKQPIVELCNSNTPICPIFLKGRNWTTIPLNKFCVTMKLTYIFDNYATTLFALFMAFWSTIFMELWKRRHAVLMYRWHLKSQYEDVSWSQSYAENTRYRRVCPVTGNFEPYMPIWVQLLNYSVTFITLCFTIIIVIMAVIASTIFRLLLSEKIRGHSLLIMIIASAINVFFIKLFGRWYGRISLWLTKNENPRTQGEFDDSYIYKMFLLSFTNNFAAMSYLAFIKGKLFTYPGDVPNTLFQNILQGDICHPAGCILALCIQLTFIMLLKSLLGNICVLFKPSLKGYYEKYIRKVEQDTYELPQWELDYNLEEMGRYFLIKEYTEMILQYGLVTFFVAAFPLAPLCAFINNMMEVRTDASKFVKYCRRPVPVRIGGIQAWNGILQAMTFLSVITNAFVIGFTSDVVKREIYRYNVDYALKGYVNSTLSKFSVMDLQDELSGSGNDSCYYRGNRNPPEHEKKYELTPDYWYEICIRFLVAFMFEHIILLFTGLIAYAVPDIPYSLKRLIKVQREERKTSRLRKVTSARQRPKK